MNKLLPFVKGFFLAFACRVPIMPELKREWYGESVDYYTASITELIGYYDFFFVLLWLICSVFFLYMAANTSDRQKKIGIIALAISILLPLAILLVKYGTCLMAVKSLVNVIKSIFVVAGFYFFFSNGLEYLIEKNNKHIA